MNEQIYLNGAPVVGFGDAELLGNPAVTRSTVGYFVGAATGGAVGSWISKSRWSTGIGVAVGGLVGGVIGANSGFEKQRREEEARS